jgi:hypothetical protein
MPIRKLLYIVYGWRWAGVVSRRVEASPQLKHHSLNSLNSLFMNSRSYSDWRARNQTLLTGVIKFAIARALAIAISKTARCSIIANRYQQANLLLQTVINKPICYCEPLATSWLAFFVG